MGSAEGVAEIISRLADDDRRAAENAIRCVRERFTTPFKVEDDMGVLEALRPRAIARLLAGYMDDGLHLFELAWARDHFVELGRRICPFYTSFVDARRKARRGAKRYTPDEATLRATFGDDWLLVRDAWPAIPFLVKVLELREDSSVSERDKVTREEAYWVEAEVYLTLLRPSQPAQPDVKAFVERIISTMKEKGDDLLVYEVLNYVFDDADGLRKRLLAYRPTGKEVRALDAWVAAFKNAARDLEAKNAGPRVLGTIDGHEVTRARGTLRRWSHEDRVRTQAGYLPSQKRLQDRAIENDMRRMHRDPTRTFLTLTEVAAKLGVAESSARNAVKRAHKAGALVPQRLTNSRSYAFRDSDVKIIKRFLGARRAPRSGGKYTIEAAAREAGVPVDRAIDLINEAAKDLDGDTEHVVSPKTSLRSDRYDDLVERLREHQQSAATGGCAKPRTS